MTDNKPNSNQANDGNLAGGLAEYLRSVLMGVDDMLPATVVSYDRTTNRAVLQPLVMMGSTGGEKVRRAQQANIKVFRFGGGGFFMSYPIKPGDFGWIKACDRDISLIMQRGGLEDWPNTKRIHKFNDAMFFPDTLKDWLISGENMGAAVFQNMSGSVSISLHDDRVLIESPTIEERCTTRIIEMGNMTITGGSLTINANIDTEGTLTNDGKDVGSTHQHDGSPSAPNGPVSPTGAPK